MTETGERLQELRARCRRAGQEHLFDAWEQLDERQRAELLDEIESVDLDLVARQAALLRREEAPPPAASVEPPELFPLRRGPEEARRAREAAAHGEELLRRGAVGYVLVAGGQASRLGYDGPKGTFPVGPVSRAPLFALHARRLAAARARHGVPTPWYVMTSRANDAATREFFAEHDWFGLPREDVLFFSQAMIPALDFEGRILRAGPGRLFRAPDGHGGVLEALRRSGALADARARGVTQLSYFQVDNPLARPADALFLGLHDQAGAGMSSKVVAKRDAAEKVGVLGRVEGRMTCIEYSDLPAELREARGEDGSLRFRAGNIAVHVLALDFVDELTRGGLQLPWHVARKRMPVWESGPPDQRVEREGAKFETFVFDALQRSPASVCLEVERRLEFSPVKNAEGEDSPATCRRDLCTLFAGWVEAAGLPLPEPDPQGVWPVEVDPRLAETREEFLRLSAPRPRVLPGGHLYA